MNERTPHGGIDEGRPGPGQPLDYRGPGEQVRPFPVALLVGAILFASGLVVVSVFVAVALSILMGHAAAGVMVLLGVAAILVALGAYGHRRPERRPFAMGIWIGTGAGVAALAVIFIQRAYWR
jgi:hypothetical protein